MTILISFMLSMPLWGQETLTLRSLKDVSSTQIQWPGRYAVMVFQKDCQVCHQQVKLLDCLDRPIYLLGAFSSEKSLRREYRKMKSSYPVYMGTRDVLTKLGIQPGVTPQLLVMDGEQKRLFVGLTTCAQVSQAKEKTS